MNSYEANRGIEHLSAIDMMHELLANLFLMPAFSHPYDNHPTLVQSRTKSPTPHGPQSFKSKQEGDSKDILRGWTAIGPLLKDAGRHAHKFSESQEEA
jgi:hypothetical protein